jgi:uncharacterized membrane protein YsdA (DUF1294 family)
MPSTILLAVPALLVVNLWTILRFWQDKRRAIAGERRIPESDLLGLALMGGSPGALLARRLFRHKTRKEPFSTVLLVIAAVQMGAIIGLAVAFA